LVVDVKIRRPCGSKIDIRFHGSASMNAWTPPSPAVALISNLRRASGICTTLRPPRPVFGLRSLRRRHRSDDAARNEQRHGYRHT
jgi:hypothetical protein